MFNSMHPAVILAKMRISSVMQSIYNVAETNFRREGGEINRDKEGVEYFNRYIVRFLVQNFHDMYPRITEVAYKAKYEFCQIGDMIQIYPNEHMKKLFIIGNVKPTAYLIKVEN